MIEYFNAAQAGRSPVLPKRIAKVHAYIDKAFHELFVSIQPQEVISDEILHGRHSHVDAAYMKKVEEACLRDARVQTEIEALKLPAGATVIVEPWTYATDGMNDMSSRITMVGRLLLPCRESNCTSVGFTCVFLTILMPIITRIR